MTREFVGVSESDTVVGAAELMRDEGVECAVVLRGNYPVGMLSARDVVAMVADRRDPESSTIDDVMSQPVVSIEADRSLTEAIDAISTNDARRMVVMEGDDAVGMLSEHDIVTAASAFPGVGIDVDLEDAGVNGDLEFAESNPDSDLDPDLAATPEDESFATQSVCEACGSLARDLVNVNGQLICTDCRDV